MAKIKNTKNELKKQKEALRRFERYLPTLILKKQQLQTEIGKIQHQLEEEEEKSENLINGLKKWVAVFSEDVGIEGLVSIDEMITEEGNIAGIDIPVFKSVTFSEKEYDLLLTPLWVDNGIYDVKENIVLQAKIKIFKKQLKLLQEELRTTTQRVNLFEKVKIPESRENIRKIQIFMGDLQTAAVVTGKIAKAKIGKKAAIQMQT